MRDVYEELNKLVIFFSNLFYLLINLADMIYF